jgi:bifunctional non-homologous end joining protein LigD
VTDETFRAGGHTITVTHADKVLFGRAGAPISKRDLAEYYASVATVMLPHLRGRPLSVQRFPDGIEHGGFMQKHVPPALPSWVHHVEVDKVGGGTVDMYVADNAATLLHLANLAGMTLHPWPSRTTNLHRPDRLIFDLDPDGDDQFPAVRAAARSLRTLLDELGLPSFPMTTGSRGMHVTVPIDATEDYDDVRAFAQEVAAEFVARHPDDLTIDVRKAGRKGRLFVDTLRNAYGQHAVAPYSVRPLPGAPVATPLDWSEVDNRRLTARSYGMRDIAGRLDSAGGDPWRGLGRQARSLRPARRRLAAMSGRTAA